MLLVPPQLPVAELGPIHSLPLPIRCPLELLELPELLVPQLPVVPQLLVVPRGTQESPIPFQSVRCPGREPLGATFAKHQRRSSQRMPPPTYSMPSHPKRNAPWRRPTSLDSWMIRYDLWMDRNPKSASSPKPVVPHSNFQ